MQDTAASSAQPLRQIKKAICEFFCHTSPTSLAIFYSMAGVTFQGDDGKTDGCSEKLINMVKRMESSPEDKLV